LLPPLCCELGLLQLLINELNWEATAARLVSAACVAILSFTGHKLYSFSNKMEVGDRRSASLN
jgi:putative flippase GtrA